MIDSLERHRLVSFIHSFTFLSLSLSLSPNASQEQHVSAQHPPFVNVDSIQDAICVERPLSEEPVHLLTAFLRPDLPRISWGHRDDTISRGQPTLEIVERAALLFERSHALVRRVLPLQRRIPVPWNAELPERAWGVDALVVQVVHHHDRASTKIHSSRSVLGGEVDRNECGLPVVGHECHILPVELSIDRAHERKLARCKVEQSEAELVVSKDAISVSIRIAHSSVRPVPDKDEVDVVPNRMVVSHGLLVIKAPDHLLDASVDGIRILPIARGDDSDTVPSSGQGFGKRATDVCESSCFTPGGDFARDEHNTVCLGFLGVFRGLVAAAAKFNTIIGFIEKLSSKLGGRLRKQDFPGIVYALLGHAKQDRIVLFCFFLLLLLKKKMKKEKNSGKEKGDERCASHRFCFCFCWRISRNAFCNFNVHR